MDFNFPHRRMNILTREWVLVSPQRTKRPWQGMVEKTPAAELPAYDATCYLCPGNPRNTGKTNPNYATTYVFDNDFAALVSAENGPGEVPQSVSQLFIAETEVGHCQVVCFSPRHDLSLPELSQAEVERVVQAWIAADGRLSQEAGIGYVQVFENKGAMMGASNPHPHSQIWASGHVPNEPAKESQAQAAYLADHGTCLLCDYLAAERVHGERIVAENDLFTALVPFWAVWPFEILLVSRRHLAAFAELREAEVSALADILRQVATRYDNLFEISFPYSMGFHQAPVQGGPFPGWHFHAHYYPPLLRSATVRKWMVGYELMAMPQRDITPESAAERLRSLPEQHYKNNRG
ncbi:MAG TPA: UDP-glucose--hexose-1-phosphate uridylyltransferase [Anaerolineaceae bacterium]|jgi:UDPglucose--hexose-1-phosphate uridylyltransferase